MSHYLLGVLKPLNDFQERVTHYLLRSCWCRWLLSCLTIASNHPLPAPILPWMCICAIHCLLRVVASVEYCSRSKVWHSIFTLTEHQWLWHRLTGATNHHSPCPVCIGRVIGVIYCLLGVLEAIESSCSKVWHATNHKTATDSYHLQVPPTTLWVS